MNIHSTEVRRTGRDGDGVQLWLWEKSFELAVAIFKVADRIPQELGLALGVEMRLAALSVPSHLSLTKSRGYTREFARGLGAAVGALSQLETHLSLCCELGYASDIEERQLVHRVRELKRVTTRVLRRLRGLLSENRLQRISEEIAALISEETDGAPGGRS
ncbi:MAG: four helix bundle protein [Candidatus Thorarchaeota archaeon]